MTKMTPDKLRKAQYLADDNGVTVTNCWAAMAEAADAWDSDLKTKAELLEALTNAVRWFEDEYPTEAQIMRAAIAAAEVKP
jgi:hypothetical protein